MENQHGAVSLFIVMFSALLLTTITISFMQLMVKDQQQASYSDLSESAYDSAVAGVEDAKRALLMQQDCLGNSSPTCNTIRLAIESGECTTLPRVFAVPDGEVMIAQEEGDRKLEQAYTCVKIAQNTSDYVGSIEPGTEATLVPLRAEGEFNKIVLHWALSKTGGTLDIDSATTELPNVGTVNWPETRPALLRAQLINGHDSFRLSDFDTSGFSNTLFLYPSRTGVSSVEFALDGRRGALAGEPRQVLCQTTVSSGEYACSITIDVNPAVPAGSQTAYLNLAAFYNATDFRIELLNDSTSVLFDGVQPEVDSTGRANDLFRRVVSRVELGNAFNYPLAALETRNNICKNFSVTTEAGDYSASDCDPTKSD